ncbi:hypothetical protein BT96DRAFT_988596 [Gymnopus androsaceus JB14]|uniref:Uncharacterized protein n=1 Tax=Gymnopus androsaceus JB14 TaxID=1447944 RepID=A0A6A4I5Y2_9AGAR|nr:hypothetical protein BT96DRAFT_988596 [Gymnopus androsaceus JB14]
MVQMHEFLALSPCLHLAPDINDAESPEDALDLFFITCIRPGMNYEILLEQASICQLLNLTVSLLSSLAGISAYRPRYPMRVDKEKKESMLIISTCLLATATFELASRTSNSFIYISRLSLHECHVIIEPLRYSSPSCVTLAAPVSGTVYPNLTALSPTPASETKTESDILSIRIKRRTSSPNRYTYTPTAAPLTPFACRFSGVEEMVYLDTLRDDPAAVHTPPPLLCMRCEGTSAASVIDLKRANQNQL